jgi:hypothetical protein
MLAESVAPKCEVADGWKIPIADSLIARSISAHVGQLGTLTRKLSAPRPGLSIAKFGVARGYERNLGSPLSAQNGHLPADVIDGLDFVRAKSDSLDLGG